MENRAGGSSYKLEAQRIECNFFFNIQTPDSEQRQGRQVILGRLSA
jgi:hypothetical protein